MHTVLQSLHVLSLEHMADTVISELSFALKRVPVLTALAICDRDGGSVLSEHRSTLRHSYCTGSLNASFRPILQPLMPTNAFL